MTVLDDFVGYAESCCGDGGSKYQRYMGVPCNTPWSAAFISYAAHKSGMDGVFPMTNKPQDIRDLGTSDSGVAHAGRWIDGPAYGGMDSPEVGDIMLISDSTDADGRADRAAIVWDVNSEDGGITVIAGDSSKSGANRSIVDSETISPGNMRIRGYFRMDWIYADDGWGREALAMGADQRK